MGNVILQGTGEAEHGFVPEFVEGDVAREDVHENAQVFPTCGDWQLNEITADMLEDIFWVDRLQFSSGWRVGLRDNIALRAERNKFLNIYEESRPGGVT